MKKLSSMVTIFENNENCVILKVKKNQSANLIALGCFDGDETMFRLTKGCQHGCTVWHGANNKHYTWEWGERGYTLVSKSISNCGAMIRRAIEDDFGIYIGSDINKIRQTLYKRKPKPQEEKYVAMWWGNGNTGNECPVVHRRGEFWRSFSSLKAFEDFIRQNNGTFKKGELYHSANTGCCMTDYHVTM